MERKTPAACEQEKAEKLVSVCREILLNARNELYLNLRFMDAALSSLNSYLILPQRGQGQTVIITLTSLTFWPAGLCPAASL